MNCLVIHKREVRGRLRLKADLKNPDFALAMVAIWEVLGVPVFDDNAPWRHRSAGRHHQGTSLVCGNSQGNQGAKLWSHILRRDDDAGRIVVLLRADVRIGCCVLSQDAGSSLLLQKEELMFCGAA